MRVAGLGFRAGAGLDSLRAALALAGDLKVDALATALGKANAPALIALAAETGLRVHPVAAETLARQATATRSPRVLGMIGTGSLCEAAALAAAGEGARLVLTRRISDDGMATIAVAEGTSQ